MDTNATGPEPDLTPKLTLPSPEDADKAEQLLRQAVVFQRRGDVDQYRKMLDEAVSLAPGSTTVVVAKAEELLARSRTKEAVELLKQAKELHPSHVGIETLYGEAVLKASGMSTLGAMSEFEVRATGRAVSLLATIIPGAGHLALGLWPLGLVYFGTVVLSLIWSFSIPNGMSGLFGVMGLQRSGSSDVNPQVFLSLGIAMVTWIVSVADVGARSKSAKRSEPIHRPAPPVDKPFEL